MGSKLSFMIEILNSGSIMVVNHQGYQQLNDLKLINSGLETLLSVVGGLAEQSWTTMLSISSNRQQIINSSIVYLRSRNFDGLDLDFEFPASGDSLRRDKLRFTSLVHVCDALHALKLNMIFTHPQIHRLTQPVILTGSMNYHQLRPEVKSPPLTSLHGVPWNVCSLQENLVSSFSPEVTTWRSYFAKRLSCRSTIRCRACFGGYM